MGRHRWLGILALAAACGGGEARPAESAPPEARGGSGAVAGPPARPVSPVEDDATAAWMRSHFEAGREVRNALIRGDLEAARAQLAALSEQAGPPEAPARWEAPLAALRRAARDAATAEDLEETALGFGTFAARCADCHRATDATFEPDALPPPDAAPAPMQRHQWATERMWQGLVQPSPERYREGATVLAEAPLHSAELVVGRSPPLEVIRTAERTRELAAEAARAETQDARAASYGRLLSTCADCHGQL